QRRGVGDRDNRARAVEVERIAELAGGRPRGVGNCAVVAVARRVLDCCPGALVERVRGNQTGRGGWRGRARGVRGWARGGGRVLGEQLVAVAGGGAVACVLVRRGRGGCDLREVAAAGALAALDDVACDPDVVGCPAPRQVDLAARNGIRGHGRRGWRR